VRPATRMPGLMALAWAIALAGCYTEIGNPGKDSQVTATFSIDYSQAVPAPKVAAPGAPGGSVPQAGQVAIERFYFNVVEVNYRTIDDADGRIWRVPDSLGRSVDFTGKDTDAVLPPVEVPAGDWTILKLESRIPAHDTLDPDTLDFAAFADRGYIKGTYARGGRSLRFLWQLPNHRRVNLVYNQELIEQWRHGNAYELEFVFYACRWVGGVDLLQAEAWRDRAGRDVAVIDLEHNRPLYDSLNTGFFRSFNSWKVWKE
jgi:hypothetical protein